VASYQSAWAPVQTEVPQRPAGIASGTVLGLAAMAAVGATGAIGLAAPARAATVSDTLTLSNKGTVSVADHSNDALPAGATAVGSRLLDPGTALAERIRTQSAQQRADADDAARRQAAAAAAAKAEATAKAEAEERAQAAARAEAAAQAEAESRAAQLAAEQAVQHEQALRAEALAQENAQRAAEQARDAEAEQARDAEAEQARSAQDLGELVVPVPGAVPGAGFGQSGSYWSHLHTGLDLAAATGTPVVAVGRGTVTSAGWAGAYGYRIVETLPDGTEIWYCQLSSIGVGGGEVTAGQPIGRVGATGNVSGPHLHLEVRPGGGEPVDPSVWLAEHGLGI